MKLSNMTRQQLIDEIKSLNKKLTACEGPGTAYSKEVKNTEDMQKRLTGIIESAMDGIISVDENQKIILFNSAAEKLFGCPASDALGKKLDLFIPQRFHESHSRYIENFAKSDRDDATMRTSGAFSCLHADGSEFPADISISKTEISGKIIFTAFVHNTSEKIIAKQKVEQSEKRLTLALQAAQMGVWEWNLETNEIFWSEQVLEITGVKKLENKLESFTKYVHPEDLDGLMQATQKAIDDKETLTYEFRIVLKDGSVKWMRDYARAEYDQNGKALRVVGTVADITEHKTVQLELKKSENYLHSIIQSIPDLVWMKDPDGRYMACNQRFEVFFGAKENEILGKSDYDYLEKELADFFRGKDLEAINLGKSNANEEEVTFASDGHREILETIKTPMYDITGKLIGVLGIGRNITLRKRTETALKESEEKFKYIFNNSVVAKSITEPDGKMHVNKAFCSMLGYTQDEFQNVNWQDITHPQDVEFSEKEKNSILSGEKESSRFIKRYIHKNGDTIWVDNNISLRRDEKGKPMYFLATSMDITEQKEAEEALKESRRRLATLMDNLPGMAYRCKNDSKWTMEFVSRGCKKLTGYDPEALINNTKISFDQIIHPEDRDCVWDTIQTAVNNKTAYELTYRINTFSGDQKWVWERGRGVYDANGKLTTLEGFLTDITQQKEAENQLRASEERFRHTLDNMLEGCQIIDHDFRYIYVNESVARHGRTTPGNLLGRTMMEVYPGIDQTEMYTHLSHCMNKREAYVMENEFKFPDGSQGWFELSMEPVPQGVFILSIDITERKQAEKTIRESEEKYRTVTESFDSVLITVDADGLFHYANKTAAAAFDVTPEMLVGKNMYELFPPQVAEAQMKSIREVISGNKGWVDENETVVKGVTRWYRTSIMPVINSSGEAHLALVNTVDISERKQAEQKLRESEEMYRTVMESFESVIITVDKDGVFHYINKAAAAAFDTVPEMLIGKSMTDIFPEDVVEYQMQHVREVISGGRGRVDEAEISIKGLPRWYRSSFQPALDASGKIILAMVNSVDITERKLAEEQRVRLTERLDLATKAAQFGIWDWDIQKNNLIWDEQMYVLYGLQPGDFGGAYEAWLNGIYPDDRESTNEDSARALRGESDYDTEFRVLWPDGTVHWIKAVGEVYRDEKGTPLRMIGINYDITKRKQAEEALHESERKLRLIAENTTDLIFAYDMNHKLFYVNSGIKKLTGYSEKELQEKNFINWLHPQDGPRMLKLMEDVYRGKGFSGEEFRIITKAGEVKWSMSTWMPMFDEEGRQVGVQGRENDITARKMAELSLQENEEKLRLFIDHAPASLAMFDTKMRYLVVSQRWKADYGLGETGLIGKSHYEIFPEIPEYWKDYHQRGLKGEIIKMEEDRFIRLDESVQWLRWEIRPWYKGDNKVGGIVVFTEDISDIIINKQISDSRLHLLEFANEHDMDDVIEETLNEAEKLTGSKIGFYHFVEDDQNMLHLQNWSTATKEVFCRIGDAKGAHYPVEQAGVWADCVRERRAIIHNDYGSLENRKGLPEGHAEIFREVVVPVIRNDKIKAILGIGNKETDYSKQDVFILQGLADHAWETLERKRAEENLRESEMKYRQLIENSGDAIFLAFNNKYELVNSKYEELLGASLEQLNKSDFNFYEKVAPKYRDEIKERFKNTLDGVKSNQSFEFTFLKDNGKEIEIEARTSYMKYKGGFATQGILRDITERKNLEIQLFQAQKMEAIGRLAGGVAHDFNNLLTIINGYSELLTLTDMPVPMKDPIEQIRTAGLRASRLTGQLLAFSRKQVIQPKVLNLNLLLPEQLKMLGRLVGEDIEISTILSEELPNIKADPGQLETVIMNIVINARDAMPVGGKLTIETRQVDVDEKYVASHLQVKPGKFVMMAISDTGTGMDEKTKSRIFEPFFTTKGMEKGTGLGLATVYGVIRQNKGFIYVYSELGKGTTFKIYFPVVYEKQMDFKISAADLSALKGNETILLVEDDAGVMKITRATLQGYGYAVLTASNGEEGLRVYNEHKNSIDLLLTDVIMPLMGGSEMAKKIKEINPSLKVIFFSGYTDDSIVQHGVLEEGVEFIQKPYSYFELAQKVRTVLDK